MQPLSVYVNWGAYDELSDNVELTEDLAMRQFDEMLRLRREGARFDAYMMDAFWHDPDGAWREWRKRTWPNGPQRWFAACRDHGVLPGLWFSTNLLFHLNAPPEWQSSLNRQGDAMCMFDGGFLPHFMDSLHMWHDRGIRLFKLDFVRLSAATPDAEGVMLPHEIVEANTHVLRTALARFRRLHPDALILAYNGFGGGPKTTAGPYPANVDPRWLDVFDSWFCGDPRASDVPAMHFWRSKDIFSDHMVRRFAMQGVPLERIDNIAFTVGTTGTCYHRGLAAWKGTLILSLARGGRINNYHGNLELLDAPAARWFGKVQDMFHQAQATGRIHGFGPMPGEGLPYGWTVVNEAGALYAAVNPSQSIRSFELPRFSSLQAPLEAGRILFSDAGFNPSLSANLLTLGAEQMALIGYGDWSDGRHDLGRQDDIGIPTAICPLEAAFEPTGEGGIAATILPPSDTRALRVVLRQEFEGAPHRSSGGQAPGGRPLGEIIRIRAHQDRGVLPVRIDYDKIIWSGLSWAVGEVDLNDAKLAAPIRIVCSTTDEKKPRLKAEVYRVAYDGCR